MDIIVTTPKSRMADAAQEAANCIQAGGGEYFRRFHSIHYPRHMKIGSRIYYVENGYIRGFATISRVAHVPTQGMQCDTTGRWYSQGCFVFMPADSWRWIKPIPLRGFQGYRYVHPKSIGPRLWAMIGQAEIVGGWRDKRPEVML